MKVKNVIKIVYILSAPSPLLHIVDGTVHYRIGNAMNELMHKKSIKIFISQQLSDFHKLKNVV